MKWAKVKEKSPGTSSKDKDAEQNKKNDAICFDEYPDIGTLKSELEQKKKYGNTLSSNIISLCR